MHYRRPDTPGIGVQTLARQCRTLAATVTWLVPLQAKAERRAGSIPPYTWSNPPLSPAGMPAACVVTLWGLGHHWKKSTGEQPRWQAGIWRDGAPPGGRNIVFASKGPCRDTSTPVRAIAATKEAKGAPVHARAVSISAEFDGPCCMPCRRHYVLCWECGQSLCSGVITSRRDVQQRRFGVG